MENTINSPSAKRNKGLHCYIVLGRKGLRKLHVLNIYLKGTGRQNIPTLILKVDVLYVHERQYIPKHINIFICWLQKLFQKSYECKSIKSIIKTKIHVVHCSFNENWTVGKNLQITCVFLYLLSRTATVDKSRSAITRNWLLFYSVPYLHPNSRNTALLQCIVRTFDSTGSDNTNRTM